MPSVRRWMAAANAISGRLFTAAVVIRDEEERGEEKEGIDYRVANSEPARMECDQGMLGMGGTRQICSGKMNFL